MEIKDVIKELRNDKGLTQAELANEINFSLSIINKWENGKKVPNTEAIKILAWYFDVTTDYILCMEDFRKTKNTTK